MKQDVASGSKPQQKSDNGEVVKKLPSSQGSDDHSEMQIEKMTASINDTNSNVSSDFDIVALPNSTTSSTYSKGKDSKPLPNINLDVEPIVEGSETPRLDDSSVIDSK